MRLPDEPRPLTKEESDEVIANTLKEIEQGGMWVKDCGAEGCTGHIGGRLASYGKPTEEDLKYCACPVCGTVGKVKLTYVPPGD